MTELQARADELLAEATSETLFSDRLAAQKLATLADVDVQAAQAEVAARASRSCRPPRTRSRPRATSASGASFAPGSGAGARLAELLRRLRLPGRGRRRRRQGRSHPPRLPGGRHRGPGRDAALRALRRHRPGRLEPSRTATAASASRSPRPTASSGRTATSPTSSRRSSRARSSPPASPSGSSARPAMRPGPHLHLQLAARDRLPAGRAVVPELRGLGLLVVGRFPDGDSAPARSSRSSTRAPARRGRSTPPRARSCCSRLRGLRSRAGSAERTCVGRMRTFVPRLVALTVVWLLATAALTYAAAQKISTPSATPAATTTAAARAGPPDRAGRPPPGLHLCQGHAQRRRLRVEADRLRAGLRLEHGRRADARPRHAGDRHRRADDRPAPRAQRRAARDPRAHAPPSPARGSGSRRSPPTRSRLPPARRRRPSPRRRSSRQTVVKTREEAARS